MTDARALDGLAVAQDWRRLSPWSVFHFAARSIVQNLRLAIFGGGGGTYGLAQSNLADYAWILPIGILAFVLLRAVVAYPRASTGFTPMSWRPGAACCSRTSRTFRSRACRTSVSSIRSISGRSASSP